MNGARRAGLFLFGIVLVALFAGFAIAQGLSDPDVPSGDVALVQDVPSEVGEVSQKDFDRAMLQTALRAGLKKVPPEDDPQYEQIKEAALGDRLDMAWITGEAADMGVTATDREVEAQLDQIRRDQFANDKAFEKFLDDSGFTLAEVTDRVRLQILSQAIQDAITQDATVEDSEAEDYYEAAREQFTTPESRDVRLIVNKDKAKVVKAAAELGDEPTEKDWKRVAEKFSTDSTASQGGLRPGVTEGAIEDPVGSRVFQSGQGELVGPIKASSGFYIFEVEKVTPEETQPFETVRTQITEQLRQQAQQTAMANFISDYTAKWTSKTFCASGYETSRCANFKGDGRPEGADPACYEADPPKAKQRNLSCPAPSLQTKPALPGSVTVLTPAGTQLPQKPVAPGEQKEAPAGVPGLSGLGGLTP